MAKTHRRETARALPQEPCGGVPCKLILHKDHAGWEELPGIKSLISAEEAMRTRVQKALVRDKAFIHAWFLDADGAADFHNVIGGGFS